MDSEADDVREIERCAATRAEKGKAAVAGADVSSSATTTAAGVVEVVAKDGRRVKLNGPIEATWSHGEPYPAPHGGGFKCYYCLICKKGGGVSRLAEHLGAIPGGVVACEKVPRHIKELMAHRVNNGRIRRKRGRQMALEVERGVIAAREGYGSGSIPHDYEAQIEMATRNSLRDFSGLEHGNSSSFGRSNGSVAGSCSANKQSTIKSFYNASNGPFDIDLARSRSQVQPRVDVMLEKGLKEKLGVAWAKWFHANDIPGRKADCPYFRSALKLALQLGEGVQIPRGIDIDGPLLDKNYEEMEAHMAAFKDDWKDYGVTVMCDSWTAAALNPKELYTSKIARYPKSQHAVTLAITKLASSPSKASAAIDQFAFFKKQAGLFGGAEARNSALQGRLSAADWWDQYGGDYPELQRFARRIVSQCMSSSGCERNWSTFALVHTNLRNRLSYDKLHKLVYVHYNLKLRIQHFEDDMQSLKELKSFQDRDYDPCSIMIDVAMYDQNHPIMEWLSSSRSESTPTLDEYDNDPESPNSPSRLILEELGGLNEEEAVAFRKTIGSNSGRKSGKKRKTIEEEDIVDDYESDDSEGGGSPKYMESGDSDSSDDGAENEDGGAVGSPDHAAGPSQGVKGQNNEPARAAATQPAPIRPRSKRLKKVSVKHLY